MFVESPAGKSFIIQVLSVFRSYGNGYFPELLDIRMVFDNPIQEGLEISFIIAKGSLA